MKSKIARLTRRQATAGIAIVLGKLTIGGYAGAQQPATATTPSAANETRTSLHQEIELPAAPKRVFEILLDSKLFAAFTGMAAQIDPHPGGVFTTFGGLIEGRSVELITGQRIVQAWRPTSWDPGVYSIVRFDLKARDAETRLVLDHTGFPQGDFDHLDPGWHERYWNPLIKYLAG
ncbi:MAG TPA: SRPBCC domain-containing protein, partial [Terracidiphilus sp.]